MKFTFSTGSTIEKDKNRKKTNEYRSTSRIDIAEPLSHQKSHPNGRNFNNNEPYYQSQTNYDIKPRYHR
jgi:hypothetical protein